jgi:two-component system, cell cycle response regulator DivK
MSEFYISDTGDVSITEEKITAPYLANHTILIAEDDCFSFDMMKHMLLETQATLLHADNGETALDIIKNNNISFVFLDIRLPGMDGYAVFSHIREYNKDLPVVAQTASALPEDKVMIRDAGFTACLTKPFSREVLFNILHSYLLSLPTVTPVIV